MLHVSVLTAEGRLFDGSADFIVVPGSDGELGVLQGHVPLVATLKPGPVRVSTGNDEDILFVSGGFVEVGREPADGGEQTSVTVLADSGERAQDIDEARAEEARRQAQALLGEKLSSEEYAAAAAALERSSARIRVAETARRRRPRQEPPVRG